MALCAAGLDVPGTGMTGTGIPNPDPFPQAMSPFPRLCATAMPCTTGHRRTAPGDADKSRDALARSEFHAPAIGLAHSLMPASDFAHARGAAGRGRMITVDLRILIYECASGI